MPEIGNFDGYFEVNYKKYCEICMHKDKTEMDEPCCECLTESVRFESNIPAKFEKK